MTIQPSFSDDQKLPTVPICVPPKSLDRKAISGSDHHASSGSTVASFLSQDILCEPWNKRSFAPLPNLDYVSVTTSEQDGGSHDDRDGPHRLEGDFRRLRVRDNLTSRGGGLTLSTGEGGGGIVIENIDD